VWEEVSPGDILLFDPRLIHVGGDAIGTKIAVFFGLGRRNLHSVIHRSYFGGCALDSLGGSRRAEFTAMLKQHDLLV
jgi:hypothetical protein